MRKIISIILMIITIFAMIVTSFMITIGVMNAFDGDYVTGVAVSGNYAYLADRYKGLVIIEPTTCPVTSAGILSGAAC